LKTGLLLVISLALAPAAHAYPFCDSAAKAIETGDGLDVWRKTMREKRFADLDRHFSGLLADFEAGKISDAELDFSFGMFASARAANEPLHDEWVNAFPKSRAAHLAQAYHFAARGWAARGSDFANKTSETQFAVMSSAFARAAKAFDAAEALAKKPTLERAKRIDMLKAVGSRAERDAIYRSTLKLHPGSLAVRYEYLEAVTPRWGGSLEQMRRVGEEARSLPADDRRFIENLVLYHTGSDYYIRDDYKQAAEYFERAMPMCPGMAGSADGAMYLYTTQMKDYPRAIVAAGRYIDRYPRAARGYMFRANAYEHSRMYKEAFGDYERGAQLGDPKGLESMARFYAMGQGVTPDFRKAIDLFMAAHEKGVAGAKEKADQVRAGTGIRMK
jgi:tetratricopeptide (TPR) repeat protein